MKIQDVKKWDCKDGKAVAVNPSFDNIGKYPPLESDNKNWNEFNQWSSDPINQPTTELTGVFSADEVEVVEVWEYRNANFNDIHHKDKYWILATNSIYGSFSEFEAYQSDNGFNTRITYTLIKKEGKEENSFKGNEFYKQHIGDVLVLLYQKFYEPYTGNASNAEKTEAFYQWLNEQIKNNL